MRNRLLMACYAVSAAAGITLAAALSATGASAAVTGHHSHGGTLQCAAYRSHILCVRRPAQGNIQFWGSHNIQFWGSHNIQFWGSHNIQFWGSHSIQFWGSDIQFWGKNPQVRRDKIQFWGGKIQFWGSRVAR